MKNTKVRRNKNIMVKVNTKNIIELILGRIILEIILGLIATGLFLGIVWFVGHIVWLCETYLIARIILFIVGGISLFALVNEAE